MGIGERSWILGTSEKYRYVKSPANPPAGDFKLAAIVGVLGAPDLCLEIAAVARPSRCEHARVSDGGARPRQRDADVPPVRASPMPWRRLLVDPAPPRPLVYLA